ncbi:MAG: hypothetical protein E7379_02800 [Clostridiales bacterium]|nr:hypothetical protein [Clostridiales bacterium]
MKIRQLKDFIENCEIFIAMHSDRKDKDFNALKKEVWQVKASVEMYESCGECMAFNAEGKYNKLKNLFWDAVELCEENEL